MSCCERGSEASRRAERMERWLTDARTRVAVIGRAAVFSFSRATTVRAGWWSRHSSDNQLGSGWFYRQPVGLSMRGFMIDGLRHGRKMGWASRTSTQNKTQCLWLGSRQQVTTAQMQCQTLTLDGVEIELCTELVCLGVVFNPELTLAVHIRWLAGKCFYHLWQLLTVRRTLTKDAAKTLVHAFITSRVDYCNSVFGNASAVYLYPLQSVLHAAARVIMQKIKYDHISASICDQLHWLSVKQRVDHK